MLIFYDFVKLIFGHNSEKTRLTTNNAFVINDYGSNVGHDTLK